MALRIARFDWGGTPLGPLNAWPDRLIAACEMMLASPQMASLAIGPERIFVYNDASAKQYGERHPEVLGLPLAEAFPHEFEKVERFYDRVFAGDSLHVPAQPLDPAQSGAVEVFDAYLIPVRADDGAVIAAQMTGFAVGDRQRAEQKYRALFDSIDQGFCTIEMIFDTEGRPVDYRFLEVNASFERLTGLKDATGTRMRERVPDHEQHWFDTYGRIAKTGRSERFERQAEMLGFWYDVFAFPVDRRDQHRVAVLFNDITERKRQEAALRDSRRRFQALVTAGTYSIYRMSADWRIMHQLDSETLAITTDPIADWADKYIPAEARPEVDAAIAQAILTKSLFQLEHRVHLADGRVGWVLSRAVPLLDEHGEITEWFGVGSDVTARRYATERLRDAADRHRADLEQQVADRTAELAASRDLLRGTMDASTDMIQVFSAVRDDAGNIVDFRWVLNNKTSEDRYGEVRGESLLERNPGVIEEGIFEKFKRVTETGVPEQAEHHYVHEQFDGWFYQSVVKMGDGVATTTKSIDDWKATQADILRLQEEAAAAKLTESEGRFRTLADTAPAMIWQTDFSGGNLFVNQYFLDYTGKRQDEISGLQWRSLVHPDHADAYIGTFEMAVRDRLAFRNRCRLRCHDGTWRWFDNFAQPYLGHDGRYLGHVGVSMDVQAAVDAENALRESEQLLALAFKTLPMGIAIIDSAGETVTANDRMRRFLPTGRIPSRDVEQSPRWRAWDAKGRLIHPGDYPAARALRGETVFPGIEMLYREDNGNELWTDVLATPLHAEDGRISGAITVVVDIDRLKRSEEAARASEERLRQFGEASQDILWIRDVETLQWAYLTPAFETIYGLSRDEALSGNNYRNWQHLILPEDRDRADASIARVIAGEWVTFEYRVRRPSDGAIRWLRNTDFPITDATGKVVLIGGIGHDVTRMKAIEREVAASEGRLRTLMEGIPQLVWRSQNKGMWTWASPQWQAFTGQGPDRYLATGWINAVHPDDRSAALDAWAGAEIKGLLDIEYRVKRIADGSWIWHHTRSVPVRDDAGQITEWLGTSTDIHELRDLQEHQKVLVAELQHRTRNLMGVVRSMADKTARASGDLPDFRARFRDRMEALARVQSLLSRMDDHDRVTFDELVETELAAMQSSGDRITLSGPRGVRLRSSTVQTLAMALHELATNAMKYGALKQPSGHLAISWHLERADEAGAPWLHIDWQETGVKMPSPAEARGSGQGRELIERALPYQLSARTSYELGADGAHCTIAIPVSTTSFPSARNVGHPPVD